MCGIAGIIQRRGKAGLKDRLEAMLRALSHRGPDGQGVEIREAGSWQIGLAHARLAILDLSPSGHQPMRNAQSSRWLTYNGEVYNFLELRSELEREGRRFSSSGDTEVLLAAWEAWGAEALPRLRGMFAFALWDEDARRLTLARDGFGIKPLYYFQAEDCLIFASEVRALLASGLVARTISRDGLSSYLRFGSLQSPHTLIKGVLSLPPGASLVAEAGRERIEARQAPYAAGLSPGVRPSLRGGREAAVRRLGTALEDSVRAHLLSDVPLGIFLSGGIDSSALTAIASRISREKPRTFSVVFYEDSFSEARYARLVAERFGTEHHEILLREEDFLALLPDALAAMDQPSADGVNTYVISRAVKRAGITVALSGLGGDELFAGYPTFQRARLLRAAALLPRRWRASAAALGRRVRSGTIRARKFWSLLESEGTARDAYAISRELFSRREIRSLTGSLPPGSDADELLDEDDLVNAMSRYEMQGYMANTLLRDCDFMGMAHALEIRVPFVDREVARCVLELPEEWKLGKIPKGLLVDALGGVLPEEVWKRPKMGFTLPWPRWLRQGVNPRLEAIFTGRGGVLRRAGIDGRHAEALWRDFCAGKDPSTWSRVWALYVLKQWCDRHEVFI
ncbi:MAG TPA: asparagine synthase (glutamine-hydrolyzing) [Elusimicrobiota bacterium]|jgi:asparagine synthase (glutamine-hydrolysing)|nr:asparagine synthase (glutamine-hydrolyzing) [Elusimicrobiota bacterium]